MRITKLALVASLMGMAACGSQEQTSDPRLAADLLFLDSLQMGIAETQKQEVVSDLELGFAEGEMAAAEEAEKPAAPARASAPRKSSSSSSGTARRSSSGSSSGSSAGTYTPQPRTVEVKHTKRDAAIGAAAGAAIGAVVAGRGERVQGAVIGGVLGGVAGAVIGNNVDKSKKVVWQ